MSSCFIQEYLELSFDRSIDYWDDHNRHAIISDLLEGPVVSVNYMSFDGNQMSETDVNSIIHSITE